MVTLKGTDSCLGAYLKLGTALDEGVDPVGDLLLLVDVQVHGYAARDSVWIIRGAWLDFLSDLKKLEQTRQGCVVFESLLPDEMALSFYVTNAVGHMALEGFLALATAEDFTQKLQFSFGYDPGDFADFIAGLEQLLI